MAYADAVLRTRRQFLAFAGAAAASPIVRGAARSTRPNIIFILADDLGYADLSCYGRPDYATPNIDRLAAEGGRFIQAYANSSVCSPSRLALITGRYQGRLRLGLEEPLTTRDVGLPPNLTTLPSRLRRIGYTTALIGKWHLGGLPKYGPLKSGYEYFFGFRGGALDYYTHRSGSKKSDLWDQDHPLELHGYLTDLLGDRTVKVLHSFAKSNAPFLISLHFSAPHWPWEDAGAEGLAESRRIAASPRADAPIDYDGGTNAVYGRMVTRMDMQVGRVLRTLEKLGMARNTIVVFTSDNGGERFSDTWPFTGKKSELLEGGLRVPAIVRWPDRIKAGLVSQQVIATMDWMPTLLEAAGTTMAGNYPSDGMDIGPFLQGATPVPRKLFWRYLHMHQEACRDGDLKYLKINGNTFLFNVAADPLERANLKARLPAAYERLVAEYRAWNATMLPLDPAAYSYFMSGKDVADHFGVKGSGY
jgi:arylsulfatase A-like enzyme